jgi:hypothetical protein
MVPFCNCAQRHRCTNGSVALSGAACPGRSGTPAITPSRIPSMTTARAFRGFRFPAEVICGRCAGIFNSRSATATSRPCSPTGASRWITRPCTAGFSASPPSWGNGCAATCARAAGRGTSTRRTSGPAGNRATCTGPSTAPARRSTSCHENGPSSAFGHAASALGSRVT